VIRLKVSIPDFWRLLPKEFSAMAEEYSKTIDELMMLEELADWRMGMICAIIANANRNPKKKSTPFQPTDFMPKKPQPKKEMTAQEMLEVLKTTTTMLGGEVKI